MQIFTKPVKEKKTWLAFSRHLLWVTQAPELAYMLGFLNEDLMYHTDPTDGLNIKVSSSNFAELHFEGQFPKIAACSDMECTSSTSKARHDLKKPPAQRRKGPFNFECVWN